MDIRQVVLEVDGITISGRLYLPAGGNKYPAVGICHGIPSGKPNDPDDGGYPELAERLCRDGFIAFIFNFRGCGDSGGNLDLLGWTRDLTAAINYLWGLPQRDQPHLGLLGFSGGAAVAIYVAAHDRRVSCVASCAAPAEFGSLLSGDEPQLMVDHFRRIGTIRDAGFPRSAEEWLNRFRLVSPMKYIAGIAPRPLLLVHGDQDETVPVDHAYRLYHSAGEPREIVIIEGAGHNLRRDDRALAAALSWLKRRCRGNLR